MKISESYFQQLIGGDDALESISRFVDIWSARATPKDLMRSLSKPELTVHLAVIYDAEIGNGGHLQFFANPGGDRVLETITALSKAGLESRRSILERACAAFPNGAPPSERPARVALIKELPSAAVETWATLDREYWALWGDLDEQLLKHLRENANDVLAPERAL